MKTIEFKHEVIDFVPVVKFTGEFSPEFLQDSFIRFGEPLTYELIGKIFCDEFLKFVEA